MNISIYMQSLGTRNRFSTRAPLAFVKFQQSNKTFKCSNIKFLPLEECIRLSVR